MSVQEVRIDSAQVDFDPRSHVGPAQFELDQDPCGSQVFHIDPSRSKNRPKKFETELDRHELLGCLKLLGSTRLWVEMKNF